MADSVVELTAPVTRRPHTISSSNRPINRLRRYRFKLARGIPRVLLSPLHAVVKWWEIRHILPPTANGRRIPLSLETYELVDERSGKPHCSNVISSANYSVYDFLPRQIIYQFSKLANIYFLFVSILQMIPSWSTTGNYTTIVPLMIFVTISITREGFDDWRRHKVDKIENNRTTLVATASPNGSEVDYVATKWKNIKVGQIVRIMQNEWIPADLVLLHSSGFKGQTYVETMALDGETNLKMKEVNPDVQDYCNADNLPQMAGECITEDPNLDLYNFEGSLKVDSKNYPLGNQNIIYRGSILRNTASCIGVVVFTGKETKIQQNALKSFRAKSPKLQSKVNWIVVLMAIFVVLLSLFGTVASNRMQSARHNTGYWYIEGVDVTFVQNLFGFIIMFNTLIPLSLYVSLEICKLFQKMLMESDINMYDPNTDTPFKCQTVSLNEELGQVGYIFSDKTGTLTENVMLFRKMTVAGHAWLHDLDLMVEENNADLSQVTDASSELHDKEKREYLFHRAKHGRGPSLELFQQVVNLPRKSTSNVPRTSTSSVRRSATAVAPVPPVPARPSGATNGGAGGHATGRSSTATLKRKWTSTANPAKVQDTPSTLQLLEYMMAFPHSLFTQKAKFFLLALALCHSASPEVDLSQAADGEVEIEYLDYQAASPDELALVSAARDLGYLVIDRQFDGITLRTYPNGFENEPVDEQYKILDTIEFSSSRKRMSNVVQFPDGRVCLFTKGADNVMIEKLHSEILEAARNKRVDLDQQSSLRKSVEAQVVAERKSSLEHPGSPLGRGRPSIGIDHTAAFMALDQHLHQQNEELLIQESSRRSIQSHDQRHSLDRPKRPKLNLDTSHDPIDARLVVDERFIIEQTLTHVDEFSTEGLRTLMYGHRFLSAGEYEAWKKEYDAARATLNDRAANIARIGEQLEHGYELTGATAIEDKLQHGVPETIEKMRRANIKLWMLTGDKRETAINIGYSCRLIKDYSTVIILKIDQDLYTTIFAALEELSQQSVVHCVVVVDGQTLASIESDPSLMSLFIDLSLKADSIIVCRASPAQKATMVKQVRKRIPNQVTLAIGDGANDIAMIKAADLGIGIAGREGLQAARSSDYSFGQFRFLSNLLLVHGRWNYVRTCKYILATFYKEFLFYMAQVVFQRYTLFTGTSLYESWSISMFNTLFTSLAVIALGSFDRDLDPSTLIAVPELYSIGQKNRAFNVHIFLFWLVMAMASCVACVFLAVQGWGNVVSNLNQDLFPLGVVVFTSVVCIINIKLLYFEMRLIDIITIACGIISIGGYQLWNLLIGAGLSKKPQKTYYVLDAFRDQFGRDACYWALVIIITALCLYFDILVRHVKRLVWPSETDVFEVLERDPNIQKRLEQESTMELAAGRETQKDMPQKWSDLLRGHLPAQSIKSSAYSSSRPLRKMDIWFNKLHLGRSSSNYERDIDEILEQRERELAQQQYHA